MQDIHVVYILRYADWNFTIYCQMHLRVYISISESSATTSDTTEQNRSFPSSSSVADVSCIPDAGGVLQLKFVMVLMLLLFDPQRA